MDRTKLISCYETLGQSTPADFLTNEELFDKILDIDPDLIEFLYQNDKIVEELRTVEKEKPVEVISKPVEVISKPVISKPQIELPSGVSEADIQAIITALPNKDNIQNVIKTINVSAVRWLFGLELEGISFRRALSDKNMTLDAFKTHLIQTYGL